MMKDGSGQSLRAILFFRGLRLTFADIFCYAVSYHPYHGVSREDFQDLDGSRLNDQSDYIL